MWGRDLDSYGRGIFTFVLWDKKDGNGESFIIRIFFYITTICEMDVFGKKGWMYLGRRVQIFRTKNIPPRSMICWINSTKKPVRWVITLTNNKNLPAKCPRIPPMPGTRSRLTRPVWTTSKPRRTRTGFKFLFAGWCERRLMLGGEVFFQEDFFQCGGVFFSSGVGV